MFWQGAARQGAHFDIRLISIGPETITETEADENRKRSGERRDEDKKTKREQRNVSKAKTYIFSHIVLKGAPKDFI